jgi:RiboL-PSP-HEPN
VLVFEQAVRQRLSEVLTSWAFIDSLGSPDRGSPQPAHSGLRGAWLVSLYGCVEFSVGLCVEHLISEINSHAPTHERLKAPVLSVGLFPLSKSARMCREESMLSRTHELFTRARSNELVKIVENPFTAKLQNTDASTIIEIAMAFGMEGYSIPAVGATKLSTLRERRNAVAHGRESPSDVGSRFTTLDLKGFYDVVDTEIMRFSTACIQHCSEGNFLLTAQTA